MKVIRINGNTVYFGLDDGQVMQMDRQDLDFEPKVGMEVEKYTSNNEIIFVPKMSQADTLTEHSRLNKNNEQQDKSIVVNVNNSSSNTFNGTQLGELTSGRVVSKLAYILLAIFLGGIGAHKFYANKVGTGFIYLIFCWTIIPSIIGFIEGIVACFKPADKNGRIIID